MSGARSDEQQEKIQDVSVRALLDEEFKSVYGGTTPVTVPWAGLTFI